MTLDKSLCWIFYVLNLSQWTWLLVLYEQPYFEVQLLCLAPPPSWLQELQHQTGHCELGLPRHWSYRHGRWRRIDGCQDIMLSLTTINYYLLFIGIFSATTTATMIVIISIYFLFLSLFFYFYLCFHFFYFIIFPIVIVNISILIISILRFSLGDFLYEQNIVWPSYVIVGLFMQHNCSTPRHQLLRQEAPWWRLMLGVASRDKKRRAWDIKKWSYRFI